MEITVQFYYYVPLTERYYMDFSSGGFLTQALFWFSVMQNILHNIQLNALSEAVLSHSA
jgi:hypothetical protein